MILTYSTKIDQLNQTHLNALNEMRVANEIQKKMIESQEKFFVEQEKISLHSEDTIKKENEDIQIYYLEEMRIANENQKKIHILLY